MSKRIPLSLTLCLFIFILSACQLSLTDDAYKVNETPISTTMPQEPIAYREIELCEIPINSIEGLTSLEAVTLCQKVLGEKDDENFIFQLAEVHTGRNIGYRCDGAVEYNEKQYYIVCVLWSDNEDIVWSTIGFLGVAANGNEIHDALRNSDGTYSLGKRLWNNVTVT